MGNAVEVIRKDLKQSIQKMQPEFARALPGHITPDKFVRTAQTAVSLTRGIEKLKDPASFIAVCTMAAADGLILDKREAALVIDYNGEAQYRPMMRGLLKLAHQSGLIKSLVVEPVHENDFFQYEPTDPDHPIKHKIDLRQDRGQPFAVYALATLMTGGIVFEVMTVSQINGIRERSDAYKAFKAGKIKSTPWSTDWSEMARKTVFRRLSKYLPASSDRDPLHSAIERIDEDFTIEHEQDEPAPVQERQPPRKEKGGAAARLKDVTPEPPPVEQEEDHGFIDNETGEFIDADVQKPGEDF